MIVRARAELLTNGQNVGRPLFLGDKACGVFPQSLPFAITAFGALEGYVSLAIIAFGAFGLIVIKYYHRLGKMDKRSLDSLIKGG